ncbi:hypothetical protein FRC10_005401 [Ceratobasidium sp. 414]|nr:hypothetical protein FRC10_005401 [Ceratobasidium sp. 414]
MSAFTEEWMFAHDGMRLYTRRYIPSSATGGSGTWGASGAKAAILFVHGFIEHVGRSPSAKYGKTSWAEQQSDIQTMLGVLREGVSSEVPIFLMGHSMGGGLSLSFPTRPPKSPFIPKSEVVLGLSGTPINQSSLHSDDTQRHIAGVIATSPLIRQTHPAPSWQVGAGGLVSKLPFGSSMTVPAVVKAEDLSHDPAVGAAYKADPYVKFIGTTKGVYDMLTGVCLCSASEKFVKEAPAKDKTFVPFEGGYHELQNEPDGVQDKHIETVSGWILAHLAKAAKL